MSTNQAAQSFSGFMTSVVCENCRQKLRIPQSRTWIRVTCPTCRHEFNYRFVDREPPVIRASSQDSVSGAILAVLGLIFVIGGVGVIHR